MTLLVTAECVDDLINDVHQAILADGLSNDPTKGSTLEILGAYLVLTDPRRRISRTESRGKLISCLGEFLWYLSAQNDLEFIKHFIPRYAESAESDGKIHGGYGPRLFNMRGLYNQLKNVINLLQEKKPTRRAVIQLFDASDLVPCVFRSIRSRIGIEVRSAIRIHSINRELNFFYRFLTRFFAAFH
ncbi:thymidylate synthase, partial [Escherichia coli]